MLVRNQFDFKPAAKEFERMLNKNEVGIKFRIDGKTLQLKWTDIEIRRHMLQSMQQPEDDDELAGFEGAALEGQDLEELD
jgi:hypothetical protein